MQASRAGTALAQGNTKMVSRSCLIPATDLGRTKMTLGLYSCLRAAFVLSGRRINGSCSGVAKEPCLTGNIAERNGCGRIETRCSAGQAILNTVPRGTLMLDTFIVRFLLATLSVSSVLFLTGRSLAYVEAGGHVQMKMTAPEVRPYDRNSFYFPS